MDNCYVTILDSDSDGEQSRGTATLISSDSGDEDYSPVRGKSSRSRGTKKGWSLLPQRLRNPRKKATKYSAVINLDTSSESSNESVQTESLAALKETQLTVASTDHSHVNGKVILDQEASKPSVKKSSSNSENVHPSEPAAQKHKTVSGSDSDSDDGAPVVKKPTTSRTFRRGLSSLKSTTCEPTPVIDQTENSSIYSTRVSNCMSALRSRKLALRVDLVDSGSDNEEGGFIESGKQGRQPSQENVTEEDTRLHDLSQNSPSRDDSQTLLNRSPSPPSSPQNLCPSKVVDRLSSHVRNAIEFLHSPHLSDYSPLGDQDVVFDGEEPPDTVREMLVKVRSRSGIQRFSLKMTETFKRIFSEMAEHEAVNESQIVMFRREESIKPTHTPESLSLHVADIIDCRIADEADMNDSLDSSLVENLITIFIQGKDSRSKTAIKIRKDEPLEIGLQKYCKQSGISMETVSLQFDGDAVSVNLTPDDLDMEDGDCVDAITTDKKSKPKKV